MRSDPLVNAYNEFQNSPSVIKRFQRVSQAASPPSFYERHQELQMLETIPRKEGVKRITNVFCSRPLIQELNVHIDCLVGPPRTSFWPFGG